MYGLIRPLLFKLDPEQAHHLTLRAVALAGDISLSRAALQARYELNDPRLAVEAFGLRFRNPVGLAAGYDKDAAAVRGLSSLGFGHVEVGTVTCKSQAGNPKPRVWRVPTESGLINSMGFPNAGVAALHVRRGDARLGINIGKGKDTPLEQAAQDYCELFEKVYRDADYVTLNVSSPNTLGLRQLQAREAMQSLIGAVLALRDRLTPRVPVLVKIAPDLNEAEIDDVLAVAIDKGIDGIIATNTTISRAGMPEWAQGLKGGLSGAPLRDRATEVIRYLARHMQGKLPIIGVGGIASGADALDKMRAGATLVQVYTGLVYQGPGLVKRINQELLRECERVGARSVGELVGAG
ncbi:MAG: quinone-dependent dihydroorotate dehydrogenase [Anaerolineae bacterium]